MNEPAWIELIGSSLVDAVVSNLRIDTRMLQTFAGDKCQGLGYGDEQQNCTANSFHVHNLCVRFFFEVK